MRRVLALLLLLCIAGPVLGRAIFNEPILDDTGVLIKDNPNTTAYDGAYAIVYLVGSETPATVYDLTGLARTPPLRQDSDGYLIFAADTGSYQIQVYGAGLTARLIYWEAIDADDVSALGDTEALSDSLDTAFGRLDQLSDSLDTAATVNVQQSDSLATIFASGVSTDGPFVKPLD